MGVRAIPSQRSRLYVWHGQPAVRRWLPVKAVVLSAAVLFAGSATAGDAPPDVFVEAYPYANDLVLKLSDSFRRRKTPGTDRVAVQLTAGEGFCYPLYYFIPSITRDGRYLIYHRAVKREVQLHRLDLTTAESKQLTQATVEDAGWYPWDAPSPGKGVLDHRSVLNVARGKVIYFTGNDGREARIVDVNTGKNLTLFELPEGREAIGQNCCTPDGKWFVYIHAPRGKRKPKPCKGAVLAAYNLDTKEHRVLTTIDSAIHHVQPYGNEHFIFCHPPKGNGMMMTDLKGSPFVHLRDKDPGASGRVCHHVTTSRGIAYEVFGSRQGTLSGLYDPLTRSRYEFPLPSKAWGYTHTGWDPDGRIMFWEATRGGHRMEYLSGFGREGKPVFAMVTGNWPTFGKGQKSHFHPQVTPDRKWILFVAGDAETRSNHIFLLDITDLKDLPDVRQKGPS